MDFLSSDFAWVLTLLAIGFAVWTHYNPLKPLKLEYQTAWVCYFDPDEVSLPSDAVMTFQDETVERLAKGTVIIWNAGSNVLNGEDIVSDDPIRVCFDEDTSVLAHEVVGKTNEANRVEVKGLEETPNELVVTFEYLNPGDGFVLHAIHDGKTQHPRVVGTAKGLSDGPKRRGRVELRETESDPSLRWIRWLTLLLCGGFLLFHSGRQVARTQFGMFLPIPDPVEPSLTDTPFLLGVGFFLFLTVMAAKWLLATRPKYPSSLESFIRPRKEEEEEETT